MKKRKFNDGGIYTADMGKPPQDIDGASAPMKRPKPGMAKPGMPKSGMPKPPMKRPAPKGSGMFREGMPVPQDIDGGSAPRMPGMKKGGSVSKRADGIATKGKTKGAQVKMKSGGKC
jgi:hypothetical protein